MSDDITLNQDIISKITERQEELELEYGSDDINEIEINEILRDEFSEHPNELEHLGINNSEDELELEEEDIEKVIGDLNDDEKKDNLIKTLLVNKKHLYELYLQLLGYEVEIGKKEPKFLGKSLIPKKDAKFMIKIVSSLYQPQTLSGKLGKNITDFDDHYNNILQNFRSRLANYSDDVCSKEDMRIAIDLFLNEVKVVRSAIVNGRLGDITRDISINSYNEKEDITDQDKKLEELKKKLNM